MPKTVVQNNDARMYQIQVSTAAPRYNPETKNMVPPDLPAELLVLNPGVNMVDEALWQRAKANPHLAKLLTLTLPPAAAVEQNPERVGQSILIEGETLPDEAPLKPLGIKAACKLIAETLDTNMLRDWFNEELRPEIRKAIDAQIASIEKPKDTERREGKRGGASH